MSHVDELERVLRELDEASDNAERQKLFQAIAPVLDLHRDALERIVATLRAKGHEEIVDELMSDPIVEPLLRGYGLVEVDLTSRVEAALESTRPFLRAHGGNVALLEIRTGVARIELTGACHSCSSSLITLKEGIEKALYAAVPELRGIEVAGLSAGAARHPKMKWLPLMQWGDLRNGEWIKVQLFEDELLVCTIDQRPFVFENRCPAGGGALESSSFHHLTLRCSCHEYDYDLRSGGCANDESIHLRVFPATVENAVVMVGV